MLVSSQRFEVEALGVARRFWAIHAHGLWVHLVRQVGMGGDEGLVPTLGFGRPTDARTVIGLDLEGESVIRFSDGRTHECKQGAVSVLPGRGSYRARLEPSDRPSFSIVVEVDRRVHPLPAAPAEIAGLSRGADARALVLSLCEAIDDAWADEHALPLATERLGRLLAFFRAEGLPVPSREDLAAPPPPRLVTWIARAVDRALSQTDTRPMVVDVESATGLSARTLQRVMPALCSMWGQRPESFRSHTRRVQLGRACSLMTNPRATTEGVARVLGFSTPNAFCRAMAQYGLPAPGAVRARFQALA